MLHEATKQFYFLVEKRNSWSLHQASYWLQFGGHQFWWRWTLHPRPAAVRGATVMCIYNWISRSLLDLWTSYITRSVKCAGKLTRPGDGAPSNPASSSRSGGQWANAYCCWKRTSVKFSQFQFSNTPTRAFYMQVNMKLAHWYKDHKAWEGWSAVGFLKPHIDYNLYLGRAPV